MAPKNASGGAKHRLMVEMQELSKEKWVNIDVRDVSSWSTR
jgi:hypothetical protein